MCFELPPTHLPRLLWIAAAWISVMPALGVAGIPTSAKRIVEETTGDGAKEWTLKYRPGLAPAAYRMHDTILVGPTEDLELPGGKFAFFMRIEYQNTFRVTRLDIEPAPGVAAASVVRQLYDRAWGRIEMPGVKPIEFDSADDEEPVFPPLVGLQARMILAFSGGRHLDAEVSLDGQVKRVSGTEEVLGEELLDDLGGLAAAITAPSAVDECQNYYALLPTEATAIGETWQREMRLAPPSLEVGPVPIRVTCRLEAVDEQTREATISYSGSSALEEDENEAGEAPLPIRPDGTIDLSALSIKKLIAGTRVRDASYLGSARVSMDDGSVIQVDWDQSVTVTMPSPLGKPLEMHMARRMLMERVQAER